MKKRSVILCGIVYILMLSVGCSSNKQVAEEMMKQERFQGVEEVATDQQINMYFAYKDIEMKEYNSFEIRMNVTSDTYPDSSISQSFSSRDGKVGIGVKTSGNNQWELETYILNLIKQCINPLKIQTVILRKKFF